MNPMNNVQWIKAYFYSSFFLKELTLFFMLHFRSSELGSIEKKKSATLRETLLSEWSRRELNPRPDKGLMSFLHA